MRSRKSEFLVPDLTPLIDVVFLLLIFFLVSSVFKKEDFSLLLELPKGESGQTIAEKDKQIKIEVNNQGFAVDKVQVNEQELVDRVKTLKKSSRVFLFADSKTEYGRIIKIFDLLKKFEITNVSLETSE